MQQPRGTYTLPVFRGRLAVGGTKENIFITTSHTILLSTDEFWFMSRRVEGHPWSVTIYINKRTHVRLSNCCEARRTVGQRLGQVKYLSNIEMLMLYSRACSRWWACLGACPACAACWPGTRWLGGRWTGCSGTGPSTTSGATGSPGVL